MDNPYDVPSIGPSLTREYQRPMGVAMLSIFTGLLGLIQLAAFIILLMNWRENNEFAIDRRLAPSLLWFFSGVSVVLAFVASIGMWRGRPWGWWLACSGLVLFVIQSVGSGVMTSLSHGAPSIATFLSVDSVKYLVRGCIVAAILAYWFRTRVRQYFHVAKTGRIKAITLAAACGIGIMVTITVMLQTIFFVPHALGRRIMVPCETRCRTSDME